MLSGLTSLASSASNKFNQLTTVAKGVLCIPSIISNLPGSLAAVGGGIVAGIADAATSAISATTELITSAISAQVAKVTGAIDSVLNTITGAIASVAGALNIVNKFAKDLKRQVSDVRKFVSDKENCSFAAASLANCMANQALNSLTPGVIKDISKGLVKLDDVGSKIADTISSPAGTVGEYMNKANSEMQRAAKIISTVDII